MRIWYQIRSTARFATALARYLVSGKLDHFDSDVRCALLDFRVHLQWVSAIFGISLSAAAILGVVEAWKTPTAVIGLFAYTAGIYFLMAIRIYLLKRQERSTLRTVRVAAGGRIMGVLRIVFKEKHVTRVFEPIYADFSYEYLKAVAAGRDLYAGWIRTRFYLDVVKTIGLFSAARAIRSVYEYITKIA